MSGFAELGGLPYRGTFGDSRPPALAQLQLPPDPMPSHDGLRPLKAWRYVGVFGPELMLCIGSVRIGRAHQSFWAVWDRSSGHLYQRTVLGCGAVTLRTGAATVVDAGIEIEIELELEEDRGVETVSASGRSYGWTRKQCGVAASGHVVIGNMRREIAARAVIDDTAAYYARHTRWRWSAGVGVSDDRRQVAWNLVEGVHDAPVNSERTIWIDGEPREVGPEAFHPDLRGVGAMRFAAVATRERRDNLLLIRSSYRQPFGTFRGELPCGLALAEGYGVMEEHDAWW